MSCCSYTISFPSTITILLLSIGKKKKKIPKGKTKGNLESSKCVEILKDQMTHDFWEQVSQACLSFCDNFYLILFNIILR